MIKHEAATILRDLQRTNKAEKADLSQLAFSAVDLETPHFIDCTASNARFVGGDLTNSTWSKCVVSKCEFVSMNFSGATFSHCRYFDADAAHADPVTFRFCELRESRFKGCDLTCVTFVSCDLFDVKFSDCRMRGAKFERPSFARRFGKKYIQSAGTFERCNLTDSALREVDFSSCCITDSELVNVDLTNSIFVGSSLRGSNLTDANVRAADFSGSDLRGANLTGMDLHQIKGFKGMKMSASQQYHLLRSLDIEVFPDNE